MKYIQAIPFLITVVLFSQIGIVGIPCQGQEQRYKVDITKADVSYFPATRPEELGTCKVVIYYRNNGVESIVGKGVQVCQFVVYDPSNESAPVTPVGSVGTSPMYLPDLNSTGYCLFEQQDLRFKEGLHIKAWIFLWSQYPTEDGFWEPYAPRCEVVAS